MDKFLKEKNKKNKGFTLIESMIAVSIGGSIAIGTIQTASNYYDGNTQDRIAVQINQILEGFDRRFANDNFELIDWQSFLATGYVFSNRQQVADFLSKALIATNTPQCGKSDGWIPEKETADEESYKDKYRFIECNLWNTKIGFGLNSSLKFIQDGTFVEGVQLDLFFDSKKDFEDNYLSLKAIANKAQGLNNVNRSGIHELSFIDRVTNNELTPTECIQKNENCGLRATYMGTNDGEDYLLINGNNSMLASKVKFQPTITEGFLNDCHRYENVAGVWRKIENVACGIGIGKKNPTDVNSGNIDYVEVNAKSLTTERVFLDKVCSYLKPDNTPDTMPCGMYTDNSGGSDKAVAIFDEAYAGKALIGIIDADELRATDVTIQNSLDVDGETTLDGTLTVEDTATFNSLVQINGEEDDINLKVNTSASIKELTVDGALTVRGNSKFENNLYIGGDLSVNSQLEAKNFKLTNTISTGDLSNSCSLYGEGSIVYFKAGAFSDLAICSNNRWKLVNVNEGQIVAFDGSCPAGFEPFDKADGRTLVGAGSLYDSDSNSTFNYNVGDFGGQAQVALTQSQLPKHSHGHTDAWYAEAWGNGGYTPGRMGSGDSDSDNRFYERTLRTREAGGNLPHENRMPYYVLNYCIYKG